MEQVVEKVVENESEEMGSSRVSEGLTGETVSKNRHDTAQGMVEEAREIVKQTEMQMQECRLLLADDLIGYEEAKNSLFEKSLAKSEILLGEVGEIPEAREVDEDFVLFEPKEEIAPFEVRDINSGRFTGVLLALLAGVAALLGLVYLATQKLGTTLKLDQTPSMEMISTHLSWFSTPFTGNADFNIGTTVVVSSVILVVAIVYLLRVTLKANENFRFAADQLKDAHAYSEAKGDCKSEMEKVDEHIKESIKLLNLYQVLLNEQNGKLERIRYIEPDKDLEALHPKSLSAILDTQKLLEAIHVLMETPMSEEGRLSSRSALILRRTQEKAEEFIDKLY